MFCFYTNLLFPPAQNYFSRETGQNLHQPGGGKGQQINWNIFRSLHRPIYDLKKYLNGVWDSFLKGKCMYSDTISVLSLASLTSTPFCPGLHWLKRWRRLGAVWDSADYNRSITGSDSAVPDGAEVVTVLPWTLQRYSPSAVLYRAEVVPVLS